MYNPATRLLSILDLLHARRDVSAHEIARVLEVDERSVRRYITMLRDMGIPIEGERGRHGGYSLPASFRLPPLMFTSDEITAVMLGLMLMRKVGITAPDAVERASAKIERVIPEHLRRAIDALRGSLTIDDIQFGASTLSSEWLSLFSLAVDQGTCLEIGYSGSDAEITKRMIAPYGLVLHGRTIYIPAYCYLRQDLRVFRLDRVRWVTRTDQTFTKPADFDARGFIIDALARMLEMPMYEIVIDAPLTTVQTLVPPGMAILESDPERVGDQTIMRCYSDSPQWLAQFLARLDLPFKVRENDDLRAALRSLAADLLAGAEY